MSSELEGNIQRITYTNPENGYTVAKVKIEGASDPVTVVGNIVSPKPGETIRVKGDWINHPKYGRQFQAVECQTSVPVTQGGIEKYLSSGLIQGIGPEMAHRIVERFGESTLSILEQEPERLSEVSGIGRKRIDTIRQAWNEQREIRNIMIFLRSYGVGADLAAKIYKRYGDHAVHIVKENPYQLAMEVYGIGFRTADRIAGELGFDMSSSLRAEAGVVYVMNQTVEEGNACYPYLLLVQKSQEALQIDRQIIIEAIESLSGDRQIIIEEPQNILDKERMVYLPAYHVSESGITVRFASLLKTHRDVGKLGRNIDADKAIRWVQDQLQITLSSDQMDAVKSALIRKTLIITGGPGTGKTTITKAILTIYNRMGVTTLLAAPTGRAAKRLSEATGCEAKTIHRLLKYSISAGGFQKNQNEPLVCDLLIIDEASMIDCVLMYHLLKALPPAAAFILIGDVNQLPSVGPGNVLKDIISSGRVPVTELHDIFRQAKESRIIINAHRIHLGLQPVYDSNLEDSDFFFIERDSPEVVSSTIVELVKNRIPRRFLLNPVDDIQVLTPMHRGQTGVENLNHLLQNALNTPGVTLTYGAKSFMARDKVMQIRNNYDKDVYNGDIGIITTIDPENLMVFVSFDGNPVRYERGELDELTLAYAVSVHKSQGSEFPAVVMPVLTEHYLLLQRNLLYTAVTRGKRLTVLVGSRKALSIAVKNDTPHKRYTMLKERLSEVVQGF